MHISGDWLLVIGALALASLIPVLWAMVDVLRRPAWQFSPGRKALWAITLGAGWLLGLWPLALLSSVLYLTVLRRRLPPRLSPPPEPVAPRPVVSPIPVPPMQPPALPPAGWHPDPSGADGQRWWDGVGWTGHLRPNPE